MFAFCIFLKVFFPDALHGSPKKKKRIVAGLLVSFIPPPLHQQDARPTGAGTLSNVFTAESATPENGRQLKIYAERVDEFCVTLHNNTAYLTFPESVPPVSHFHGYLPFHMDRAAG